VRSTAVYPPPARGTSAKLGAWPLCPAIRPQSGRRRSRTWASGPSRPGTPDARRQGFLRARRPARCGRSPALVTLCTWPRAPSDPIHTTAIEAAQWLRMLLNDGEYDGRRILEPATVRRADQAPGPLPARARRTPRRRPGFAPQASSSRPTSRSRTTRARARARGAPPDLAVPGHAGGCADAAKLPPAPRPPRSESDPAPPSAAVARAQEAVGRNSPAHSWRGRPAARSRSWRPAGQRQAAPLPAPIRST
jgi:hypothetical protein